MSRSTGMCESDDGRDDLMPRSAASRESGETRDTSLSVQTWSKLILLVFQRYTACMELCDCFRLYRTECISHSPVYLPKQACNAATPSRLLLLAPGHAEWLRFGAFLLHHFYCTSLLHFSIALGLLSGIDPEHRVPHVHLAASAPRNVAP